MAPTRLRVPSRALTGTPTARNRRADSRISSFLNGVVLLSLNRLSRSWSATACEPPRAFRLALSCEMLPAESIAAFERPMSAAPMPSTARPPTARPANPPFSPLTAPSSVFTCRVASRAPLSVPAKGFPPFSLASSRSNRWILLTTASSCCVWLLKTRSTANCVAKKSLSMLATD